MTLFYQKNYSNYSHAPFKLIFKILESHAAHSSKPSKAEQEKLIQLANDTHALHDRMATTEDTDELHIVYQVFQLCLSALKKWSTVVDVPFGAPKFEAMSIFNIVTAFVGFDGESTG
ncbi:hypothetical protein TELCIR_22110, partial [Teladorsagia circumcincta]